MRIPFHTVVLLLPAFIVVGEAANLTRTNTTCVAGNAISANCKSNETPYYRDIFYVGGQYVYNSDLAGQLTYDQIYVEKLSPVRGVTQPKPIIFFHGGGK